MRGAVRSKSKVIPIESGFEFDLKNEDWEIPTIIAITKSGTTIKNRLRWILGKESYDVGRL